MKTNRCVHITMAIVVVTLLVASGVSRATLPVGAQTIQLAGRDGKVTATDVEQPEVQPGDAPAGLTASDWATMQDLMREARYQFDWQVRDGAWAYRAPNQAHDLSLSLDTGGFHAARYSTTGEPLWDFALSLTAYGAQTFPAASLSGNRERVEYRWSRDVVEWYVNSADGVEHGLTLAAPPAGSSTVELTFALRGSLVPELAGGGRALQLKDASGSVVLLYDQLAVYAAGGKTLPAHMRLAGCPPDRQAPACTLHLVVDAAGAAYPLTLEALLHSQTAKLTASDAKDRDDFGYSVAISGDTVVVGARYVDGAGSNRGAVYVFARNEGGGDNWGQVKKLVASDAGDADEFGYTVAIDGDTIVVGAYLKNNVGNYNCVTGSMCGAAYVFARNEGGPDNWGEVTILAASDADENDLFGQSVAISGDTIVVGAPREDGVAGSEDRGAAYVFARNEGGADNWGQVKKLIANVAEDNDRFGCSVAISGDTIVVGAHLEDGAGDDRGAAYIFGRNQPWGDNWGQVTVLYASDAEDADEFGYSVGISGDTVVVGSYYEDGAGVNYGSAYIFERNQGGADSWGEVKKLTASDAENYDYFGKSVGISGDTVVVGAGSEDGAGYARGAAYLFERNQGGADNWGQARKLTASDTEDNDYFGHSVAISGDTVVVGARLEDGMGIDRGAAYLFVNDGGRWQEIANPHASDTSNEDRFGISVAISGDTAVVGADWDDGAGGTNRGAAYVFERNQDGVGRWGQVTKLTVLNAQADDYFGRSVSISGDTVAVGAWREDNLGSDRGTVYVFERNEGGADVWGQVAELTASDPGDDDYFGFSAAISGDTLVVGARGEQADAGEDRGAAYVFARNKGGTDNWGEVKKLLASDEANYDYFGYSVAISGDTIVVGAYGENGPGGDDRGAAYVFERNYDPSNPGTPLADNWGEIANLEASDDQDQDRFGISVAISGDILVVGAYWEDGPAGGTNCGAAYVFERNQGGADNWGEVKKLTASDAADNDEFGRPVAISGDTIVVGAHLENGIGFLSADRGAAYVFERNYNPGNPGTPLADNWGEVKRLRASAPGNDDYFGFSVAISEDTIIVGAFGEDGAGTDRGVAYVFNLLPYQIYLAIVLRND